MKRKYLDLSIIIPAICLFAVFEANAQLSIDAQFRPRFYLSDGYRKLAAEGSVPTAVITQRTRLSISYCSEKLKIKFSPQDVRVWGDEELASTTGVFGKKSSLDLYEGYAEIKIRNLGWISVGRQKLVYDNERLLGARNWNQNGIAYDAVVLKFGVSQWDIHIGGSWNSLIVSSSENLFLPDRIKSLNFIWLKRNFNDKLNLSFLHIASGVTETDSTNTLHFRQTTGINAEYISKRVRLKGNAYYQYGKNKTSAKVSAFLIDADLSYKIGKLRTGLGLSYLSGNKYPEGNTDKLFNILYGARHRYFGRMDYFRDFVKHTNEGGLVDYYAYVEYKLSDQIKLTATGHNFYLAQLNYLTPDNKNLGVECDMLLSYSFNEWGLIKSGYMFYLPTNSLKILQNVPNDKFSNFFYLELTIKPNLFKQKS